MDSAFSSATLLSGLILGWSVAWPPGPINAEMIRRGLLPKSEGGGFWPAWRVGLGGCAGDFIWALGVSAGAGALINTPKVRIILGVISLALLLFLAGMFTRGAWRAYRDLRRKTAILAVSADGLPACRTTGRQDARRPSQAGCLTSERKKRRVSGFLLGFTLALTSPWNIGFWLAVIGSQSGRLSGAFLTSVFLAGSVVLGAIAWGFVLCIAVRLGARIFSRPSWQVATQALTAAVMLYFAVQLVLQFR